MKRSLLVLLFSSLLLGSVFLVFGCGTNPTGGGGGTSASRWSVTLIDDVDVASGNVSIALTSVSTPCVSYYDSVRGDLRSGRLVGSTWQTTTVESTGTVGYNNCLAVSTATDDQPGIVFSDSTNNANKYAKFNGSTWNSQNIYYNTTNKFSLVYDTSGKPRVAFVRSLKLFLATLDGTWSSTEVDSTDTYYSASVALDAAGNPMIAYAKGSSVKFATWETSSWITTSILPNSDQPSLALNSVTGYPMVAYVESSRLMLARYNGSTWTTEEVASIGNAPSLAIDSSGNPHICYIEYPGLERVRYAKWNGSQWEDELVYSGLTDTCDLALDSNDKPHIIIGSANPGGVWYAKLN